MSTDKNLIAAATRLLDTGGEQAVTLRAVGRAAGVSHNAPYKHFANRSALLAEVATVSFAELAATMRDIGHSPRLPLEKLTAVLETFADYKRERPARYRLLFNTPETSAAGGELKANALETFEQCRMIVQECQQSNALPQAPSHALTSLIFATLHGLLSMESNGPLHPEKGLTDTTTSMRRLLDLLMPASGGGRRA